MRLLLTIQRSLCVGAVAAAAFLTAGVSVGEATALPQCSVLSTSPVVFSGGQIVVHRAVVPDFAGAHDWACPRSGGRGTLMDDLDPTALRLSRFTASGAWVAALGTPPEGPREIELLDIAGGHSNLGAGAGAIASPLHLASSTDSKGHRTAALVWVDGRGAHRTLESLVTTDLTLDGREDGGSMNSTVASGAIQLGSVRLRAARVGFDVSFVVAGQHQTVSLPDAPPGPIHSS
jgi:hypothetical protein